LKTTPTALNTLRSRPPQSGQTVSGSSLKLCWASSGDPQAVQEYW
jgi:hypothetical protein